jgi:hypothetical protein
MHLWLALLLIAGCFGNAEEDVAQQDLVTLGKAPGRVKARGVKRGKAKAGGTTRSLGGGKSGAPAAGKWGRIRSNAEDPSLTPEQRAEIEKLEALGYADGTRDGGADEIVTLHDLERAGTGYNLFTSGHGSVATLVDMQGNTVHSWEQGFWDTWPRYQVNQGAPGTNHFRRAHLYENGDLLAIFEGRGILRLNSLGELMWGYQGRAHHDMHPDGDVIYVLTREAHLVRRIDPQRPILEDFIAILDAKTGTGKKRVSLIEAFENSEYDDIWKRKRHPDSDIFHTNSIQLLDGELADRVPAFSKGRFLVSMRQLSCIAVVDIDIPKVVWAHTGDYKLQHDPKILDNGNLLLFDNAGPENGSRVVEFDPTTMEEVWSYAGSKDQPFDSRTLGTAERLSNGNTLITESEGGRAFEVTSDGEIVWEFFNPHRAGDNQEFIAALFDVVRVEERPTWLK